MGVEQETGSTRPLSLEQASPIHKVIRETSPFPTNEQMNELQEKPRKDQNQVLMKSLPFHFSTQ